MGGYRENAAIDLSSVCLYVSTVFNKYLCIIYAYHSEHLLHGLCTVHDSCLMDTFYMTSLQCL